MMDTDDEDDGDPYERFAQEYAAIPTAEGKREAVFRFFGPPERAEVICKRLEDGMSVLHAALADFGIGDAVDINDPPS